MKVIKLFAFPLAFVLMDLRVFDIIMVDSTT
jgi:hypothetical protein